MSNVDLRHVFVLDPELSGEDPRFHYLPQCFPIDFFTCRNAFLAKVQATGDDFIILISFPMLKEADATWKNALLNALDHRQIGLIADVPLEDLIDDLMQWQILHVISHVHLVNQAFGKNFIECLDNPMKGFGLAQYFNEIPPIKERHVINIKEKKVLVEEILTEFRQMGHGHELLYDIRLVLEESLNNAICHAYKDEDGKDKYSVQNMVDLQPEEKVSVLYGCNSECAGFAVTDRAGSLSVQTIFRKLKRQFSGEGIFDENGRGLFLTRLLTCQLIINLNPGHSTQLVALFTRNRQLDSIKPFRINYLQPLKFSDSSLDPELD